MSDVTVEQARIAAKVLLAFDKQLGYTGHYTAIDVAAQADGIEREQAEKAKRDKRIEEIGEDIFIAAVPMADWDTAHPATKIPWLTAATRLLDRYPSLLNKVPRSDA